jgi:hypothetical protein
MWATQLFGLPKPCVSMRSVVHQGGISTSLVVSIRGFDYRAKDIQGTSGKP